MLRSFFFALFMGLLATAASGQSFVAGGLDLSTLKSAYMGLEYVPETGRVYIYPGDEERPKDYLLTVTGNTQPVIYDNPVLLLNLLHKMGWHVMDSWETNRKDPTGQKLSNADPGAKSRFYMLERTK